MSTNCNIDVSSAYPATLLPKTTRVFCYSKNRILSQKGWDRAWAVFAETENPAFLSDDEERWEFMGEGPDHAHCFRHRNIGGERKYVSVATMPEDFAS